MLPRRVRRWLDYRAEDRLNRRTIGIRCSRSEEVLWFHVPFRVASNEAGLREELRANVMRLPTDFWGFTPDGIILLSPLLRLEGVFEVDVQPHYVCVRRTSEASWRQLLPVIVGIIRNDVLRDPAYPVRVKASYDPRVPQWHQPLVEKLFGTHS